MYMFSHRKEVIFFADFLKGASQNGFLERAVNIARDIEPQFGKKQKPLLFVCAVRDIIERMCLLMNLTQLSFLALRTNSIRSSPPLSRARVDVVHTKGMRAAQCFFPDTREFWRIMKKKEHTFSLQTHFWNPPPARMHKKMVILFQNYFLENSQTKRAILKIEIPALCYTY